tara:strand:+ start:9714 stop:10370 length:657 start_codon:yes stop_codon:yes gene_type:complete
VDEFASLFANKTVAAVGPSGHLMGKGLGQKIDSYDLICRFNEVRPKGLENDYGSRVDVMFWHLNSCDMKDFKLYANSDLEGFKSSKLLVYPRQHGDVNRRGCSKSRTPKENAEQLPDVPFYQVDTNKVRQWENKYSAHLTVGVLGLMMIMETSFKELFVSGFSFYKSEKTYHPAHPTHLNITKTKVHGGREGIQALRDNMKNKKNITGDYLFEETILT